MMTHPQSFHFSDFTEERYRAALQMGKRKWRFGLYPEEPSGDESLWRHDLDISLERALRLAEIEREEGIRATYFLHFHSAFYNAWAPQTRSLCKTIEGLGHELGLHFDVGFYQQLGELNSQEELVAGIEREAVWFQQLFGRECRVISFHNPDQGSPLNYDAFRIGRFVNATSSFFRKEYHYVSDSNGYWRFDRLEEVLLNSSSPRIHVLTHPEWWSEQVLSPRERFESVLKAHSESIGEYYRADLTRQGRLMPE